MSNRSRGQAFELKIKKYLESLGFTVDKARAAFHFTGPGKGFSSPNDFFGCGDLLGVHPLRPYTLVAQCSLDPNGRRRARLEAINWNFNAQRVTLWSRQNGIQGGVRVERLDVGVWTEFFFRLREGAEPPPGIL